MVGLYVIRLIGICAHNTNKLFLLLFFAGNCDKFSFPPDAALIPLIEDLFKELAMIEACNKVFNSVIFSTDLNFTAAFGTSCRENLDFWWLKYTSQT